MHAEAAPLKHRDLDKALEDRLNIVLSDSGPLLPVMEYLSSSKGKLLRPRMAILCCQAINPAMSPKSHDLLDLAVMCELVHMASLVHDDIIDNSSLRRGLPTIHLLWGVHSAVLAGDFLFTRAHAMALKYRSLGIPEILSETIQAMCLGEVSQDMRLFRLDLEPDDYFFEISGKTGALFGAASRMGALLGGAPASVSDSLFQYGLNIGRAFQIIDDIEDMVMDQESLGKPVCSDLKRGLITLPVIFAVKDGFTLMERDFQKREVSQETVEKVKRWIIQKKYHQKAGDVANDFIEKALRSLEILPPSPAAVALRGIGGQLKDKLKTLTAKGIGA